MYQTISKDVLPKEYGGTAGTIQDVIGKFFIITKQVTLVSLDIKQDRVQ